MIHKRAGRTWLRRLAMCGAIVCLLAIARLTFRWSDIPFDQTTWNQSHASFWSSPLWAPMPHMPFDNQRARMVSDLIHHRLRTGMTQRDVQNLLGENDGSSGGGTDVDIEQYWLLSEPTWMDRQMVQFRWHTANPCLFIEHGGPHMTVSRFWVGS